jgi:hypothetical protein
MYGKARATTTKGGHHPKHDLIGALRLRSRTDFARLAFGGRSEDAPVGEKEGDERRADENRAEGSSAARLPIQAPPRPSDTSTSGPRQQADARIAAMPPAASTPAPVVLSSHDDFLSR